MAREKRGGGGKRKSKAAGRKGERRIAAATAAPPLLAAGDTRGPDFLCVGAQKAGTRWLFDQLAFHPDFWMPPIKELHYFNKSKRFLKFARPLLARAGGGLAGANRRRQKAGERPLAAADVDWLRARIWMHDRRLDLDQYARLFSPRGDRLSGDICPPYAILPEGRVKAVRERFPEARIVYLARDPIERFWSQYCMILRRNPRPSPETLDAVRGFVADGTGREHSALRAVLGRWRQGPGDGAFGLFFFDDLKTDADGLRRRIVAFLGGDPDKESGGLAPDHNRKADYAKIPMSAEVRDYLTDLFADEIRFAAAELGGRAEDWKSRYGL